MIFRSVVHDETLPKDLFPKKYGENEHRQTMEEIAEWDYDPELAVEFAPLLRAGCSVKQLVRAGLVKSKWRLSSPLAVQGPYSKNRLEMAKTAMQVLQNKVTVFPKSWVQFYENLPRALGRTLLLENARIFAAMMYLSTILDKYFSCEVLLFQFGMDGSTAARLLNVIPQHLHELQVYANMRSMIQECVAQQAGVPRGQPLSVTIHVAKMAEQSWWFARERARMVLIVLYWQRFEYDFGKEHANIYQNVQEYINQKCSDKDTRSKVSRIHPRNVASLQTTRGWTGEKTHVQGDSTDWQPVVLH